MRDYKGLCVSSGLTPTDIFTKMESSRIRAFLFSCILAVLLTGLQIFPVQGSTLPSASTTTKQSTASVATSSSQSTASLATSSSQSTASVATSSSQSTASVPTSSSQSTASVPTSSSQSTASVATSSSQSTASVATSSSQSTTSAAAGSSTSTNSKTVTASVTTETITSVTSMVTTTAVKSSTTSGHSSSSEVEFSTVDQSSGTLGTSITIISGSTSSYATSAATSTTPSQLTSSAIESTTATTTTTVAVSSSTPSHLPAPNISISETNLLLASDSFFVELQVNSGSLEGITLEIYNAGSTDVVQKVSFNESDTKSPFSVVNLNATLSQLKSVALILYSGPNATNGLVLDKLIFMRSDGSVAPSINETFTNPTTMGYITIVNNEKFDGLGNISLSRCWSGNNNSNTFIVTQVTKNGINNCTRSGRDIQLLLTSETKCEVAIKSLPDLEDVKLWVAKKINAQCQCGMTPLLLEDPRPKCGNKPSDLLLTLNLTGAFPKQVELFVKAYQESIQKNTDTITTQSSMTFTVVNCTQQCLPGDSEQNNKGKYSVTVAVVLSCIAVFSIIFIAVIVYMKRKRRGLSQFRMTRLAEDDDDLIGDMEDFVGSSENHEPSFRNDSS